MKNELELVFPMQEGAPQGEAYGEKEQELLQGRLYALLSKRSARYVMGDSSSLPVETARELLRSICFTLRLYRDINGDSALLASEDWEDMLKGFWPQLEDMLLKGRKALTRIKICSPAVQSLAYSDTVRELGVFFQKYDHRFFAHAIPCSIDYQLSQPVPESMEGIEYINEYLRRLRIENRFCSRFEKAEIVSLCASLPDYYESLINLYDEAAQRSICHALTGGNVRSLLFFEGTPRSLSNLFRASSQAEVSALSSQAAARVSEELALDAEERAYLFNAAEALAPRLFAAANSQASKS